MQDKHPKKGKQAQKEVLTELNELNDFLTESENEETSVHISEPNQNKEKSQKRISLSRLYLHLSTPFEVFLMIIGLIVSIVAGLQFPILCFLLGDTLSKYNMASSSNTNGKSDDEINRIMEDFKVVAKDLVDTYFYVSIGVFLANFFMNSIWNYVGSMQIHHLKEKYFGILLKQDQKWFDKSNVYEYATKVQAQLEQIQPGLGENYGRVVELISRLIFGIVISLFNSWKLTLVTLALLPIFAAIALYITKSLESLMVIGLKTYEEAGGITEEVLYNIKTVASFANFSFEEKRFEKTINEVEKVDKSKAFRLGLLMGLTFLFVYGSFIISVIYGRVIINDNEKTHVTNNTFNGGEVLTVFFTTTMCFWSFGYIASLIKMLQEACMASIDYFELVDNTPILRENLSCSLKPRKNTIKGRIEFRNVHFSYDTKKPILKGINISIEPGTKVAFVGESGCGKSTIVNLLERMYEADTGDIFLEGINLQKYDINYLRSLLGYVQQEPVLFNSSIRENIIFGREEIIKEEFNGDINVLLEEAYNDAYATEFIRNFNEKDKFVVGIKGSKLSGGQKQRIALARAILCKPKVLILDEATSALDNKAEQEVQKALDRICAKNVTTIIIAHRLSTIINADIIYCIKDGIVIEQGKHQDLLNKKGYYAHLFSSQLTPDKQEEPSTLFTNKHISEMKYQELVKETNALILPTTTIDNSMRFSLKNVLSLLKNNKADLFFALVGSIGNGFMNVLLGLTYTYLTNGLFNGDMNKASYAVKYLLLYALCSILHATFLLLKEWKTDAVGTIITCSLRQKIFNKYLRMNVEFFDKEENSPGALLAKLSIDTMQLNTLIRTIFGNLVSTISCIIIGLSLGFAFGWRITLIYIAFLPFTIFFQTLVNLTNQVGRASFRKINIEAGGLLSESIVSSKTIYSFNCQKHALHLYMGILDQAKIDFIKDSLLKGLFSGLCFFTQFVSIATLYHFSAVFMIKKTLDFDNMNQVNQIVMMTDQGIEEGLANIGHYKKAAIAFQSLYSILTLPSSIDSSNEGNMIKKSSKEARGKIEFKNVSFAYPTKPNTLILKNINFTIEPGQAIAFVGLSGSGKSTIVQLIERFYEVNQGEILIDDVNIKEYNMLELREKIGLVSQEPMLFKRSIDQNILYGKLNANTEEIEAAAQKASISHLLYKTKSDSNNGPVSGGEKQRVAIARAFLKNPAILLLDEATSALDKKSENEVQKSIFKLQKSRTSITIAHRLNTIEKSDLIFFIEEGRIVEKGNHAELIQSNGKYSKLYHSSQQH